MDIHVANPALFARDVSIRKSLVTLKNDSELELLIASFTQLIEFARHRFTLPTAGFPVSCTLSYCLSRLDAFAATRSHMQPHPTKIKHQTTCANTPFGYHLDEWRLDLLLI